MTVVALSSIRFRGLIAPEEPVVTADFRMFTRNSLTHRRLPRPVMFTRTLGQGRHVGAVAVARLESVEYVPGKGWMGEGSFLDPRIVPEVTEAIYLVQQGVSSPSVDLQPDVTAEVVPHPIRVDEQVLRVLTGRLMGFTFVPYPAFEEVEITVSGEQDQLILASAGITFAVNASAWRSFPIAERETEFNYDLAVPRLVEWSGGASAKFKRAFLYQVAAGDVTSTESYLLPVADVISGKLVLIPRAVFSAAAFLSGAHGGLPQVPENDLEKLRNVVTDIYAVLQEKFGDPRLRPPWTRGGRQEARGAHDMNTGTNTFTVPVTFSVTPAPETFPEVITETVREGLNSPVFQAAEQDEPEEDCPDGKVRNSDGNCVNAEDDGSDMDEDRNYTLTAAIPTDPPRAWFENPRLSMATALTVADDGRVYGHLASWNECHVGIGNRCVTAPHSATNYSLFKVGEVRCSDGSVLPIGKITLGTGHADPALGYVPASEHYDNTGSCVAVVNIGEDRYGIWVAGTVVPGVDDVRVAELRRSPLSGDWRKINGNLELVAALAVNTPGFPVLRASADAEDDLEVLLAAGVITRATATHPEPDKDREMRWRAVVDVVRSNRIKTIFGE